MTTATINTTGGMPSPAEHLQLAGAIIYVDAATGEKLTLDCWNLTAIRTSESYRVWRKSAHEILSAVNQESIAELRQDGFSEGVARYIASSIKIIEHTITNAVKGVQDPFIGDIMDAYINSLHAALIALLDHLYHKRHGSDTYVFSPTEPVEMFEGIVSYQDNGHLLAKMICDVANDVYIDITEQQN